MRVNGNLETRTGLVQIYSFDIQQCSNMPPCEGDFTPWIRALRLPTTFSMSESENECEWVTIFLDDSPARNMEIWGQAQDHVP